MRFSRYLSLLLLLALAGCQARPAQPAPTTRTAPLPQSSSQPASASLAVQADPPGAQVAVDGQPSGASPITLTLPSGVHQMALSAPGYAPLSEPLTLTVGQEGMYSPVLADIAPPTVTLSADPQQVPWLGQSRLRAGAKDNREVAELQLLLDGQVLGDVQGDDLNLDFAPAAVPGLLPGTTYTLTARAADAAGHTVDTSLPLAIGPLPGQTPPTTASATPQPGAAGQSTPAPVPTLAVLSGATPAAQAQPAATQAPPAAEAAGQTSYLVDAITIPTYPYTPYLRSTIDARLGEYPVLALDRAAYQAANPQPVPVTYTRVVLENRYLRLSILPDLGGRIYECVFKPTGHNELYSNPVIKPTSWGPGGQGVPDGANWWLAAGGLEWGFPVEEHGYESGKSWGYDFIQEDDGGATVTVLSGDYQRPYVAVNITLPPDSASFTVSPRIVNPLAAAFRFKWWDTALLAPGPANKPGADLRFIVPGSQVTVHSTNDNTLPAAGQSMSWPTYGGRDLSRLGNWHGWLGFFARPAAQAGFAAVYDTAADEGMVRVFPPDVVRGVKGFGVGWSAPIDAKSWTDDGSGYVELHGGLQPTFDDWSELPPGGQITWAETWYPAAGTGGLVYANENGAINVARHGAGLQIAVQPVRPLTGQLEITLPGQPPISHQVTLSPDRPYHEDLPTAAPGEVTITLRDPAGQALLTYRGG